MITVNFTLTKEDALELALYYYSTSPTVKQSRRLVHFCVPIIMLSIGLTRLLVKPPDLTTSPILLVIGVGYLFFYPRFHKTFLQKSAENMFAESAYEKAFGPCSLSLTDEGINSTSPIGEAKYAWSAINRVHLTSTHLLILLAGPQGFAIPRKQVPEATIQEIKAFTEKMIPAPTSSPSTQN